MSRDRIFPDPPAPTCRREPRSETRHGVVGTDEYHWLRADDWRAVLRNPALLDPEIRAHLEAENAYQERLLADGKELRKALVREMRGRVKKADASVPSRHGRYAYGVSYVEGGQHPRYVRVPAAGGEPSVLLDGDREAQGKAYFELGGVHHSRDHAHLVWGFDDNRSERFTLRTRDLETGLDLEDVVEGTVGEGVWSRSHDGFFYVRLNDDHRPPQVFHHALGAPAAQDRLIYEETDPGFFVSVAATRDGEWLVIQIGDHETSEVRLLPAGRIDAEPRVVEPRAKGRLYDVREGGDVFFILTNADGAKDFRIMTAPVHAPSREN